MHHCEFHAKVHQPPTFWSFPNTNRNFRTGNHCFQALRSPRALSFSRRAARAASALPSAGARALAPQPCATTPAARLPIARVSVAGLPPVRLAKPSKWPPQARRAQVQCSHQGPSSARKHAGACATAARLNAGKLACQLHGHQWLDCRGCDLQSRQSGLRSWRGAPRRRVLLVASTHGSFELERGCSGRFRLSFPRGFFRVV